MQTIDLQSSYTHILDLDAHAAASKLVRGTYQYGLIRGTVCWSGADLQGRAKSYGGGYARSREALLARMGAAGLHVLEVCDKRGARRMIVASRPFAVQITYTKEGETCEIRYEEGALVPPARTPKGRRAGVSLYLVAGN